MYYNGERTLTDLKNWNPNIQKTFYQLNPKNEDEYRTIYMKWNPFANKIQPMYSNYVNGTPPDGMEEVNPRLLSSLNLMQPSKPEFFLKGIMIINLKLSPSDEQKLKIVMKKDRRPFTTRDAQRFFLDQLNRAFVS